MDSNTQPVWLQLKRLTIPCIGENMEQLQLSCIAGGRLCGPTLWRTVGTTCLPYNPAVSLLGTDPSEMTRYVTT